MNSSQKYDLNKVFEAINAETEIYLVSQKSLNMIISSLEILQELLTHPVDKKGIINLL